MVKDKIVQYLTFEFSLLDLVSDQTCRGEQVLVDEFTRVCRLVRLQVSCFCQFGFTLNAVVQFFPCVLPLMHLQTA